MNCVTVVRNEVMSSSVSTTRTPRLPLKGTPSVPKVVVVMVNFLTAAALQTRDRFVRVGEGGNAHIRSP